MSSVLCIGLCPGFGIPYVSQMVPDSKYLRISGGASKRDSELKDKGAKKTIP